MKRGSGGTPNASKHAADRGDLDLIRALLFQDPSELQVEHPKRGILLARVVPALALTFALSAIALFSTEALAAQSNSARIAGAGLHLPLEHTSNHVGVLSLV